MCMEQVFERHEILDKNTLVKAVNIYLNMSGHKSKRVYLCIGYPYRGDSLGPFVGSLIEDYFKDNKNIDVIGTIENPVTAKNIGDIISKIDRNREIVCIDAAYGICGSDYVKFVDRGIKPRLALGDNIERVGDISLVGAISSLDDYNKQLVEDQAVFISHTIIRAEQLRGEK